MTGTDRIPCPDIDTIPRRLWVVRLYRWLGLLPLLVWINQVSQGMTQGRVWRRLKRDGELSAKRRVLAIACWNFPIYSQTFIYQELLSLIQAGYDLRFVYSWLESRDTLQLRFNRIWEAKTPLSLHKGLHQRDLRYFHRRMPDKVEDLIAKVSQAAGLAPEVLLRRRHFLEAFSYARLAEHWRPHYLHSYFFYQHSLYSLVAAWLLDLPRGISCYADHMLDDYELKLVELQLELADVVIATSGRIKEELLGLAPGVEAGKILVKPNAIDCECFPAQPRRERSEDHLLITVCRIEPKKGLVHLVEAMDLLRNRGVDARLHILGTYDHGVEASERCYDELKRRITEAGLEDRIKLAGRQREDDLARYYAGADLFIAPFVETAGGDKDGIPTVLLEALSSGLPVVVTDAGSMEEVVTHECEGLVVPQADPRALATAMEQLLGNQARRERMGVAGARRAREAFDTRVCDALFHERVERLLR